MFPDIKFVKKKVTIAFLDSFNKQGNNSVCI